MAQKISVKVSSRSAPGKLAGYISKIIKDQGEIQLQMIGAGAVNQSVKGIAIARRYVRDLGIDLACLPSMEIVDVKGRETTSVKIVIRPIPLSA